MSVTPGGGLNEDQYFCLDVQEGDPAKSKLIVPHVQAKGLLTADEVNNGNSGSAKTIDWTSGLDQKITLTANTTLTFTAPKGPCDLFLKVIQDGTGSRTITWPAAVKWAGGTAVDLTDTAAATDIVKLHFDGTNYYGSSILNVS